jgi:hypothetical protein
MRRREQEEVARQFAKLAGRIGLLTGEITVTVSNGKAVKIEALQPARSCCINRGEGAWETTQHEIAVRLDLAPEFVMEQLEQQVVDLVGKYGHVTTQIDRGSAVNLLTFTQLYAPKSLLHQPLPTTQAVQPGAASPALARPRRHCE